jgi:pimeloyl-ACP methyl ester carboxylesterase
MSSTLPALLALALTAAPTVETRFARVAPPGAEPARSPGQNRAVVLLHGLGMHLISKENVTKAALRDWQKTDSTWVKRLAQDSDVYAFAYGQNAAADEIAELPDLGDHIAQLRQLGYREIVLVGHSAGAVIARQFVEDNPKAGVTKVIQVCPANGGSGLARVKVVRSNQVGFLESLTKDTRHKALRDRADKVLPDDVEFVCVVGTAAVVGDGVVLLREQWTTDLQKQGVPVYPLNTTHLSAVRSRRVAELVADLVREPQPRWDAGKVAVARKLLLGAGERK